MYVCLSLHGSSLRRQICREDPTRPEAECLLLAEPLSRGVRLTPLLRERSFGTLDALPLENYNQVTRSPEAGEQSEIHDDHL